MAPRKFRRRRDRAIKHRQAAVAASIVLVLGQASAQAHALGDDPAKADTSVPAVEHALEAVEEAVRVAGAPEARAPLVPSAGGFEASRTPGALRVSQRADSLMVEATIGAGQVLSLRTAGHGGTDDGELYAHEGVVFGGGSEDRIGVEDLVHGFRLTRTVASPGAGEVTRYELRLPAGWTLQRNVLGQVALVGTDGQVMGVLDAPWAVTADGELLPTSFSVEGSTVVQHVDLPANEQAYPVVIDPRYTNMSNGIPHTHDGIARNYMRGFIRPEKDIAVERGYYPRWGNQHGVLRAVRQDGGCTVLPDTGPYWDFQVPCRSHDYCYDLRRVGTYPNVTRRGCDDEFLVAMNQDCDARNFAQEVACRDLAVKAYTAVRLVGRRGRLADGDPTVGEDAPDPPDDGAYPAMPVGPWEGR